MRTTSVLAVLVFLATLPCSCQTEKPLKRVGMTCMLKDDPEAIRKYDEYHANAWPEVVECAYSAGIRRVFIYRLGRQLFLFIEALPDFDPGGGGGDKMMEYHPRCREWDELMRTFQTNVPGQPEGSTWVEMTGIHVTDHVGTGS